MKSIFSATLGGIARSLPQWMVPSKIVNKAVQSAEIPVSGLAPPVSNLSVSEIGRLKSLNAAVLSVSDLEQLATVFYKGIDGHISKDLSKAVEYWTAAGQRGSLDSLYFKALCVRRGDGIAKDTALAFKELSDLATVHDHSRSHYTLGVMYLSGEGGEINEKKSFEHFKKAAYSGVLPAYHNLGNALADGRGVEKNESEALKCYEAAAKSGDPSAMFTLGTWHYRGRAGLEINQVKSFELQLEAAKMGHPMATYNVGSAYLMGDGVSKNEHLASIWLERAVTFNIPAARMNLGNMYRFGVGVERNLDKAIEIFSGLADEKVRKEFVAEVEEDRKQQT